MKLAAGGVLGLGLLIGSAAPAGAQPDLTQCGAPAVLVLDDLLPGEASSVDVQLCNTGTTAGMLGFVTSATDPFDVTFDGAGTMLLPGQQRTFSVAVSLAPEVGNDQANRSYDVDFVVTLTATDTEVITTPGPESSDPASGAPSDELPTGAPGDGGAVLGDGEAGAVLGEEVVRDGVSVPVVGSGGPLARTGNDIAVPVLLASSLVLGGIWMLAHGRRRPSTADVPR